MTKQHAGLVLHKTTVIFIKWNANQMHCCTQSWITNHEGGTETDEKTNSRI